VLTTIKLDDQSPLEAAEIDDEREDLMLAVKLHSACPPVS
jgi:hypothetical protein